MKKNTLINFIAAIFLALPLIYLLYTFIPKYYGEIIVAEKEGNTNYSIDVNGDGVPESIQFKNINGKEQLYNEVWSNGSLIGIWQKKARLVKGSIKILDIDNDKKDEIIFVTIENDSIFGNILNYDYDKTTFKGFLSHRVFISQTDGQDSELRSFKTIIEDINNDGFPDLITNINYGILTRGIYEVDFKNNLSYSCPIHFIHVTDFYIDEFESEKRIVASSYANGNIPVNKLKEAAILFGIDSTISESYYSDCYNQIFILDEKLNVITPPVSNGVSFSMQRLIPLSKSDNILALESGINESDTIETLRLYSKELKLIKERQVKLNYNKSLMTKYSREILYKINAGEEEKVIYVSKSDSIMEVDPVSLEIKFLAYFNEVKSGANVIEFDIDRDNTNEILFLVDNGIYITKLDLTDGIFLHTEGRIKNKNFSYTLTGEKHTGVRVISNGYHYILKYGFNVYWYLKWPLMVFSILIAWLILFILQRVQSKKLEEKNKQLELVVTERTYEITLQKEILEEKNKEITDSINYAKRIQNAILPPHKVVKEYLAESFILYKPKDIVAGDFYWMEQKDGAILFAAADCTGHGVPGAMVSVVCNNGLNRSVREFGLVSPGEILDKTRELVIQEFEKSEEEVKDGMDISICSLKGHQLLWSGANNPLWIIRNGELIEYKADKQPIGKYANAKPFKTHEIELEKGDTLYIFTDGYVDQFGGVKSKKFLSANFKKLLLSVQELSLEEQKERIDIAFENWKVNEEQVDDVCVIGVRI